MRSIWAAAFLLRRIRAEVGVALLIVVLVGGTAFLFAAAPRIFNRIADEGLRHELEAALAVQRNLQVSVIDDAPSGPAPLEEIDRARDFFFGEMPDSVAELVRETDLVITSVRFRVQDAPRYANTFITLRHHEDVGDAIRVVEGRLPASTGDELPRALFGFVPEDYEPPSVTPLFEIALSDATAEDAGLALGDVYEVVGDSTDARLEQGYAVPLEAEFEVVGIFEVVEPDAELWYDERALQVLNLGGTDDNPLAFTTALIHPDAFAGIGASGLPFAYDFRYFVDTSRLDSSGLVGLTADLQRLETQFLGSAPTASTQGEPVLRTGLPSVIEDYVAQRAASEAILSVAAIGPLVLAGGAVGMVGVLLVSRRRASLALARGRGASGVLLLGAQLWEALLLAGAAAVGGALAAGQLVPGRSTTASPLLALAVGAAAVLALLAATWPAARRPLRELSGGDPPALGPSARRLVLEGTAVVLAVGAIFLLRQRGLTIGEEGVPRFDPLLAATPALAGMAVGIVAMRLYPYPIIALSWLAARRRDLVPVLGLRSVGRHPGSANLPLLVLMLTAAFGAFASVVTSTVDRGQLVASWDNLGADYRIERIGGGPVSRIDPAQVDGVDAVARAYLDRQAAFRSVDGLRGAIVLYGIEPEAYARVVAGSPVDPQLPSAFVETPAPDIGSRGAPIPAILSRRLPFATQPINRGTTFEVEVAGQAMTFVDVEERTAFPGLPGESIFAIVPFDALEAAYANETLQPNLLLVRGSAEAGTGLETLVRDQLPLGRIESRHAAFAELQQAPLVAIVANGFRGALLAAAIYLALAVLSALTLSAAARTRDLAFLRTLGMSARQALQLTIVEHGPPVLIALVPGVVLGVGVAYLLAPSLGLSAFAGTERAVALTVDWAGVALLSGALLAVVAAAIGLSTLVARRARSADALRIGED